MGNLGLAGTGQLDRVKGPEVSGAHDPSRLICLWHAMMLQCEPSGIGDVGRRFSVREAYIPLDSSCKRKKGTDCLALDLAPLFHSAASAASRFASPAAAFEAAASALRACP